MISIDLFLGEILDNLLGKVDALIGSEFILFLSPKFITDHPLRQLIVHESLGFFPA
jgi:hypothetical protein